MKETTEIVTIQLTVVGKANADELDHIEVQRRKIENMIKIMIGDTFNTDDINVNYQLFIGDKEVT